METQRSGEEKLTFGGMELVYRPKDRGGLGILNLSLQNARLLLKMVHKFINHMDIPWVNMVWEVYYGQGFQPTVALHTSFWW